MTEVGGAIGADRTNRVAVLGADPAAVTDDDAAVIAAAAVAVPDDAAAAVGTTVAEKTDTVAIEEPGVVESVATWLGETAKGYATGAVNGVLDAANLVNLGVNEAFDAAGIDYRLRTDMKLEPTSSAEGAAQDAITLATAAAGAVGLVKSAPAIGKAIATGIDDATTLAKGGAGGTGAVGRGAAAVAPKLGDLRPHEIKKIQAAADELGADIYIVGSAAKGTRRNLDTDLPLADGWRSGKAGTRSDIDYVVRDGLDDAANRLDLPDVDPGFRVRGLNYLNLDSSPAIRFSPGRPPEVLSGGGRLWLD